MPINYTFIMISWAGAKFSPEYWDRNLIVKTQCVKQMWLSGKSRASPVVSVSSKTQLARLIWSSLQQPLQHSTIVAVFLYVLLLLYLSLSLSLILIPQVGLLSHISPQHLSQNACLEQQLWQFHWHYGFYDCQILVPEISLKSRKNGVTSFCCEAFNLRHWNYM